jgi:hypothetical protein
MDSSDRFEQLAQRDTAFAAVAARGRRRTVIMMILACLPAPFLVMMMNNDTDFATTVIPVGLACFGAISYSWSKWKRRPEDAQSIAFVGLSRTQRGSTYRSMWRGSRIDDPVVLTIVEAMHQHMRRGGLWLIVAATVASGALGAGLAASSGQGGVAWFSLAIAVLVTTTVAGLRWVNDRAGLVIRRSRPS